MLCAKPRTYARIKEERKKSEIQGTKLTAHKFDEEFDNEEEVENADEEKILDGFFLVCYFSLLKCKKLCNFFKPVFFL